MAGALHTLNSRKGNARELRQLTLGPPQQRAPSCHLRADARMDGLSLVFARPKRLGGGRDACAAPHLDERRVGRVDRECGLDGSKELGRANVEARGEPKQRVERQIRFAFFNAPKLPSLKVHSPRGLLDAEAQRFAACAHRRSQLSLGIDRRKWALDWRKWRKARARHTRSFGDSRRVSEAEVVRKMQ